MRPSFCRVIAAFAVFALTAGCYTTKVVAPQATPGRQYDDRQWFTIGGLVPLSSPAGQQCSGGLATAESRFSGGDFLINIALGLAGGLAGAFACGNSTDPDIDAAVRTSCATLGASLVPFLLASRSVSYTCLGGERAAPALERVQTFATADAK
jgi:hypothetical protein